MKNRVFTTGEVATVCGVSADTVSRWFDLGQIDGYRLGPGGDRRIPIESLRSFMLTHGIPLERLESDDQRILVVDDDPYYLDIIPAALATEGDYKVYSASTGFDAGLLVVEHTPHVVILDIHLSDMDGRRVCERIKSRVDTKNSRVLGISGFLDETESTHLKDFGFDDFLYKPFEIRTLLDRVSALLKAPPRSAKSVRVPNRR